MKSRKGFTLVELLGVIVILSMIVLVTVPALITTLTNSEEKAKEEFEKTMFLAAETYFQKHSELFPQLYESNGKAYVQIRTLIEEGYLKETLIDPNTDQQVDQSTSVQAVLNSDGTFKYSFQTLNLSYQGYEQTGLVLMYDGLQKVYGSKLEDLSPRGYDGVLRGIDSASGWQGNRIRFDGQNDNLEQVVPVTGDFTFEIVLGNDIGSLNLENFGGIFSVNKWTGDITDYPSLMLFYDARSTRTLSFRALVPATESQAYKEVTLGTTLLTALKAKNTFTFVKAGNTLKVYFNNSLVGSNTDTSFINRFTMTTMNLKLGAWENTYTYFDLYAFRIYNTALSAEQIKSNYELDRTRF